MSGRPSTMTHYRTCPLCEALCGLAIQHRDGEIVSIRGDRKDPKSRRATASKSAAGLRRMKEVVHRGAGLDEAAALELERQVFGEHLRNPDAMEGLRAFREKRRPRFSGM